MAEKPEDLNLPQACVNRIIKEAIPPNVHVSKEVKTVISKAASVFVLYTTACANNLAISNKRKTLLAKDIIEAMNGMNFSTFVPELETSLKVFRDQQKRKKDNIKEKKNNEMNAISNSNPIEDNIVETNGESIHE
ncbi:DNA polymerase II subunit 3 [Intoshia linei]|uniref:DNA polymerase epsilon subunit 3 n=1 Tax=Intoshia linei TaxID=1819745 RepID=A0A177AWW4_9BILA|nr:DNA polymerase II subunit 3 [Intoshia linei]